MELLNCFLIYYLHKSKFLSYYTVRYHRCCAPRYRLDVVGLLPLSAASYHTRPWQYLKLYSKLKYIPLGLRRRWCVGPMRRIDLITFRSPYLLPHCGFPFSASQLGKSYVRKKVMQWICRRFTPPSSTALLFPAPSHRLLSIDNTCTTLAGDGSRRN